MVPLHGTCLFEVKAKLKPPESWRPFLHMRLAHLFCRDNETRGPSLNEKQKLTAVQRRKNSLRCSEGKTHCSAAKECVESAGHRVSICERDSLKQTSNFERNARS